MAEQHLNDLEHALAHHGWRATDTMETRGARRWGISGSWEIVRGARKLFLDFEGGDADGLVTYPVERAFSCHVRGQEQLSIYFEKRTNRAWRQELDSFVAALDHIVRVAR